MKKLLLLLLISITSLIKSQSILQNELHSPDRIRQFADYLFCETDYLRAIGEYDKLLAVDKNDTLEFKIFLSYSNMGKYNLASEKYFETKSDNVFADYLEYEYYRILFRTEMFETIQQNLLNEHEEKLKSLEFLSYLFTTSALPERNKFLGRFQSEEQNYISQFYTRKTNPPYKNPTLAGILSSIIPGSGKIYIGEYGDGIVAFIATSLFAFLSYDNFKANHNFRGWLFAGIGLFFYAGNIYGSVASAQVYNAGIDYQLKNDLIRYLETRNYLLPEYEFCD